jgi:hypothetical protein
MTAAKRPAMPLPPTLLLPFPVCSGVKEALFSSGAVDDRRLALRYAHQGGALPRLGRDHAVPEPKALRTPILGPIPYPNPTQLVSRWPGRTATDTMAAISTVSAASQATVGAMSNCRAGSVPARLFGACSCYCMPISVVDRIPLEIQIYPAPNHERNGRPRSLRNFAELLKLVEPNEERCPFQVQSSSHEIASPKLIRL